ncbi:PREDICTED: C-type lectin domain family 6 member A [Propithecus coquereli]|uniref:C-type lectin domain family 6 member A n=1 Tax=Propithecus coquereli TaxID=379532 RepID=UPI00063F2B16|nr:PREDICTED: C-type lectin domain family 6 member A [Propithecus coquereli]
MALLSVCFIVSCVVTYHFTHGKIDKRLSELHVYHSGLTCFSEGTRVTDQLMQFMVVFHGQNFIVQQLNESLSYFLGLSDPQGNGNWQWIDQTPFKKNVRFWHPNEPNFPAEQCGSIVFWKPGGWGWNDVFCGTKRNSICEMKKIYL